MDTTQKDLAFFKNNLQELLDSSFPEKAYDSTFITKRSNYAYNAYDDAKQGKNTEEEAEKIANSILFENLYFSKFNAIFQVVSYEFDMFLMDEELRPFALKMLDICDHIFNKYDLTDDFEYSTSYDNLYQDLKEYIWDWIKSNSDS
ncbi:DUF1896 family protein [Chryseobacterium sp. 2987]|uniref:DUF1896 family protein n=1 Tax=Chryseobacterium sp. 2987 TaxID=2817767 RepID=UPI00285D79E4|nr:DUF1896 family protein [Chryseobacterium sp. 2987]MDR6919497.1 hypothetical protein [Chryseobacterium sp. 2987]